MSAREKIESIRAWMCKENLQAFLVGSGDAHQVAVFPALVILYQYLMHSCLAAQKFFVQSEYVAEWDKRREFLTGFTGSAGTGISKTARNEHLCSAI